MIADSSSGAFEAILIYKLDRFARNRYDSALYKRKLRDNGVRVISATENINDTPEGIILEGLLESVDEYYSAELSRKCKRGLEESFKKGRFIGAYAPFGYKVVDHKLTVDEQMAPIALEIFQRYVKGERQSKIMADLNRRGIPNTAGNPWNGANVSLMLRNPIYIGRYTVSTMEGVVECPAIIPQELYDAAQEQRAKAIHESRQHRYGFPYILTGKMVCAKCGYSVCGHSIDKGKWHYYSCHRCNAQYLVAEKVHEAVHEALREYLTEEKADQLAAAAYAEYINENAPSTEREVVEKELTKVEKRLQNAVAAILDGFGSESLKATMKELEERKQVLLKNLESISAPAPNLTLEHFRFALEDVIQRAETKDLKQLFDTVINHIIVKEKQLLICINLTDNANTPPMEQLLLKLKDSVGSASLKIHLLSSSSKRASCVILSILSSDGSILPL